MKTCPLFSRNPLFEVSINREFTVLHMYISTIMRVNNYMHSKSDVMLPGALLKNEEGKAIALLSSLV